jgi:hypothetical protein
MLLVWALAHGLVPCTSPAASGSRRSASAGVRGNDRPAVGSPALVAAGFARSQPSGSGSSPMALLSRWSAREKAQKAAERAGCPSTPRIPPLVGGAAFGKGARCEDGWAPRGGRDLPRRSWPWRSRCLWARRRSAPPTPGPTQQHGWSSLGSYRHAPSERQGSRRRRTTRGETPLATAELYDP